MFAADTDPRVIPCARLAEQLVTLARRGAGADDASDAEFCRGLADMLAGRLHPAELDAAAGYYFEADPQDFDSLRRHHGRAAPYHAARELIVNIARENVDDAREPLKLAPAARIALALGYSAAVTSAGPVALAEWSPYGLREPAHEQAHRTAARYRWTFNLTDADRPHLLDCPPEDEPCPFPQDGPTVGRWLLLGPVMHEAADADAVALEDALRARDELNARRAV